MKHQFYFTGYSDDVVIAGSDKKSMDEYYATYYLLSNGLVVKARHSGEHGWEISPTTETEGAIIIEAVDKDDSGDEHTDPRIPDWLGADGYAPILILESDEPLEIVATNSRNFTDVSPEFIMAAKLRSAVISGYDEEDCPCVEAFRDGLIKCGIIKI